jgi:hypothetical protein
MSMSDCPKCWETPCCCGYEYKQWSKGRINNMISMLKKVLEDKTNTTHSPPLGMSTEEKRDFIISKAEEHARLVPESELPECLAVRKWDRAADTGEDYSGVYKRTKDGMFKIADLRLGGVSEEDWIMRSEEHKDD